MPWRLTTGQVLRLAVLVFPYTACPSRIFLNNFVVVLSTHLVHSVFERDAGYFPQLALCDGKTTNGTHRPRGFSRRALGACPMSISVNPDTLRLEIARRGWDAIDLARASRLSAATVSAALAGKPVSAHSVHEMAKALARTPVIELIDKLVSRDRPDLGLA